MKKIAFLFCSFLIVFLVVLFLFPGIRAAHDFPYVYNDAVKEGYSLPQTWSDRGYGFGQFSIATLWSWPVDFLYGLGAHYSIPFEFLLKLLGVAPAITLGFWGTFWLLRYFKIDTLHSVVSALFYTTTTYFLLLLDGGQLSIAIAYGFFPLVFLEFEKAWFGDVKEQIKASVLLAILGFLDIRFVYVMTLLLVIRFFFLLIYDKIKIREYRRFFCFSWNSCGYFFNIPCVLDSAFTINQCSYTSSKLCAVFTG